MTEKNYHHGYIGDMPVTYELAEVRHEQQLVNWWAVDNSTRGSCSLSTILPHPQSEETPISRLRRNAENCKHGSFRMSPKDAFTILDMLADPPPSEEEDRIVAAARLVVKNGARRPEGGTTASLELLRRRIADADLPPMALAADPSPSTGERERRYVEARRGDCGVFFYAMEGERILGVYAYFNQAEGALKAAPAPSPLLDREAGDGVALIAEERRRQVEAEGWTPEHDDAHDRCELARAAVAYATPLARREMVTHREVSENGGRDLVWRTPRDWPWDADWWKPTTGDRVRELVKAGALLAAEIDRLQRLTLADEAAPLDTLETETTVIGREG